MTDLGTGRVALVTGAARGIGASVALRLAQDGHDVAVLDVDADRCAATVAAVRETGRRSVALGADARSGFVSGQVLYVSGGPVA